MATLQLNTVGPLMMAKFFSPLLQKAEGVIGVQSPEYKSFHAGVLVNISAKTGSIAANGEQCLFCVSVNGDK
jgi:NAD(P)-dependent dehydrogenase (short-subunit alcohol dehydrogenase family)